MISREIFKGLQLQVSLLLVILQVVKSIDKELPSFIELSPLLQYYAPGDSSIELRCIIWPSTAKVQFMVSSKKIWPTALNPSKNIMELNLLDKSIGELISPGILRISNQNSFKNIQDQNLHCLASTDFASVLSHPFRITRAGMSEFGGDLGNQSKTVEKLFFRGNVAIIDCWPPESHPRADVKFKFNSVEIKNGGKYRIIEWPSGKRVSLLIHPVEESDNGQYRCTAYNSVTGQTKISSEIISVKVEVPQMTIPPSISVPISGRLNGPQQITARRGANVTLFCVMHGHPAPQIQIYNYNNDLTASNRYFLDRKFGLLHIVDVKVSDGGSYMCSDKYITSSAVLRIVEPLNITTRPTNVVLQTPAGHARFDCVLSKPSVIVQWFFNGQPIPGSSNGSVYVPAVTVSNLGLYQCVAQDHEEWVSASATLSISSYNLLSQPVSPKEEDLIRPPLLQNVDSQQQILSIPIGSRIHDNIAVYVSWRLASNKLGNLAYFLLQYVSMHRHQQAWSAPVTLQNKINHTYHYVTDRHLKPQTSYRYRVHTFFSNGHTITSNWSKEVDFFNVGDTTPVIVESSVKYPGTIVLRWSYHSVALWPVDTFRVLIRQQLTNSTPSTRKFDKYSRIDVPFPTMVATMEGLNANATYQVIVYGINGKDKSRTITKYSPLHTVLLPPILKIISSTTPASKNNFFVGLFESWKNNRLLYGSLFALTGFLIVVMFLLLLLCLCRQRRFRNSKDAGSSHAFPYAYKEVTKSSLSANNNNNNNNSNNNNSTLQMPGRMPQYSSQLALQQFQSTNGSIDRRTIDTGSQIHRDNSCHAMETASLVTDLYSQNYVHGAPLSGHIQYPYQAGFSTLPQGYPSGRNNGQYQHFLQQQHGSRQENPTGTRDSGQDHSVEMPSRHMSASQQQLLMMQSQEHQRANMTGYYGGRAGAMSPQMMAMMMGSQQSLGGPYGGPYRSSSSNRSNSQNYQGVIETPIAIGATGHPMYQMDHMAIEPSGRPLSPQYHYMPQQQASMHPAMADVYNQSHGYIRPGTNEYSQNSLYRQQCRRSDSEFVGGGVGSSGQKTEPGYSYLPSNHHGMDMMGVSSRQHTLNSLPEQPGSHSNNNNNSSHDSQGGNNSSGRHHHRRKTRSRQQNIQDNNPSLERVQCNQGDLPPMLAPRSKMPYASDNGNMFALSSLHDSCIGDGADLMATNDCNSDFNTNGDHYDPPLQYSAHYDPNDPNDNDTVCPSNSMLIDNLPRIRDVSEYGIPITNNNNGSHQRSGKHHQPPYHQVPVPPVKSAGRYNGPSSNNGYNMESNPDYYSSATSSDRSGPSPPPKYALTNVPITRQDEAYMKNLYYHGDTHC